MPRYAPHDVNVVLGTLDHSSSSGMTVDRNNNPIVTAVLNKLDTAFALSEDVNKLREVIFHDDEAGTSSLRWLPLGDGHAPFYIIAINSAGDQQSETAKRRKRLFKRAAEHGTPVVQTETHEAAAREIATTTNSRPSRNCAQKVTQTRPDGSPIQPLIIKIPPALRARWKCIIAEQKGLCLTVRLSLKSFPMQPFADEKKMLDLKIDVYCNGEHVGCDFVPSRARQPSNQGELIHRFHGKRVDRVGERPWVLRENIPATLDSDHAKPDAKARWGAIARQISLEAKRLDQVPGGKHNELAKYLAALANLDIPQQVIDQQRPLDKQFGVIDVVITTGRGKKYDPKHRYLCDPANMDISELTANRIKLGRKTSRRSDVLDSSTRPKEISGSSDVSGKECGSYLRGINKEGLTRAEQRTSSMPATEIGGNRVQPLPQRATLKRSALTVSSEQDSKRRRVVAAPVQAPQTPESTLSSPAPTFQSSPQTVSTADSRLRDVAHGQRTRRSQFASSPYETNGLTTEQAFQRIGLVEDNTARRKSRETMGTGNVQTSLAGGNLTHAHPSPACAIPMVGSDVQTPLQEVSRLTEESPLSYTKTPSVSGLSFLESPATVAKEVISGTSKTRQRGAPGREMSDWTPGALHEDSVLSYAGTKLRQVRSSRSGWFEESSIMFGVRYVIF